MISISIKKHIICLAILAGAIVVSLAGCASSGGEFGSVVTQGQKESIIIGQTTKTQILRELGTPDQTIDLGNNKEQLSYIKEVAEAKGGLFVGMSMKSTYTEFWIILENGIVIDKGERPTTKQPSYFK